MISTRLKMATLIVCTVLMYGSRSSAQLSLPALTLPSLPLLSVPLVTFHRGDLFISLEPGPVQWRLADGTLRSTLPQLVPGTGEGMAFDPQGNLYVTRWCIDATCSTGNTVEKYNALGASLGAVGSGYNCNPHAILFVPSGMSYIGQAGCNGSILKFMPGSGVPAAEYMVAPDVQGAFWIDLGADGCTMFYTSFGPNVKRFDTCGNVQLSNFNVAGLPGGIAQDLRVLPDGGILVSSGQVIVRLNSQGSIVRTYRGPAEDTLWSGLDLGEDGTFWVGNYRSSNVYKFNLATGAIVHSFNAGTPPNTVVGIRIMK
jgi:outer membrane protein assembly factor BamB